MNPEFYEKLGYRVRLTQNTQKERGREGQREGRRKRGTGERGKERERQRGSVE